MIATANLLPPLILRSGSDTYVVTKFAIIISRHLPETEQKYITASNLWYRVLFVCPNLSPSGYYVYML